MLYQLSHSANLFLSNKMSIPSTKTFVVLDGILDDTSSSVTIDDVEFKTNNIFSDTLITDTISKNVNPIDIDGVTIDTNTITCATMNYTNLNYNPITTYGEVYIAREGSDYSGSATGTPYNFSNADWTLIQSAGSVGTWYQIGSGAPAGNVFTIGMNSGITTNTSGFTITTTGVYRVICEFVGNVDGGTANTIEVGYGVNGQPSVDPNVSPRILCMDREPSSVDTRPYTISIGEYVETLTATDVITLWMRWVQGSGGTQNLYAIRCVFRLIKVG